MAQVTTSAKNNSECKLSIIDTQNCKVLFFVIAGDSSGEPDGGEGIEHKVVVILQPTFSNAFP